MLYKLKFITYKRRFKQPLLTHHGRWKQREGILIKLTRDDGKFGLGEIAPLPWFGTETIQQALNFCQSLPQYLTEENINTIPENLPCCQFCFESALNMDIFAHPIPEANYSALLPAAPLAAWQSLWQQNYHTFKWKIGIQNITEEITILQQLINTLPAGAKLRLDANTGLTWQRTNQWLQVLENYQNIEFLEQPLPANQLPEMIELSQKYATPLALDESVSTLSQIKECYAQGWRGIYVIKPLITGFPSQLKTFCQNHAIDTVFSSVFETSIGRNYSLRLASEISFKNRALGFGIEHWFADNDQKIIREIC